LFPHVSQRQRVYVFPTVHDADYVLLDVAGTSAPLGPDALYDHVQRLLLDTRFELLEAEAGFLLFARDRVQSPPRAGRPRHDLDCASRGGLVQCPSFLTFTRPAAGERFEAARADLSRGIELVGYKVTALPAVNLSERRATVVLYFRAQRALDQALRLVPFLVGTSGAAREHDVGNSAQLWLPTTRWTPGEVVAVRYPPLAYVRGERLAVGLASEHGVTAVTNVAALP
jgi:hypothetical protein